MQDGTRKRGSKARQNLVKDALALLGTTKQIADLAGVTPAKIRNWKYEGRICRAALPKLIPYAQKIGATINWLQLVKQKHNRQSVWSKKRKQLQEVFILLGGQAAISNDIDIDITRRVVKHWGHQENIFIEEHAKAFLRLCQKRYKQYNTGKTFLLIQAAYRWNNKYQIDIHSLHRLFTEVINDK